jgi:hypothetical protein
MHITRSRSLTAIAAGALALTALAGCGSDDKAKDASAKSTSSATSSPSESPSDSPTDATGAAGDTSGDAGTPAAPGERLTAGNLVATMLAAMREKKTAHMTMEIGSSISADADVRYTGAGTDMKMSMDMGASKASVVLVDGTMYLQQTAGGKYTKITKDTPVFGELLSQMSSFGPESSISAMKGALKKVEYAGTDTVEGDKVSKYHVTVDTSAISGALGGAAAAGTDLPKTVTYDLYVDNDHLMRRIDMTVSGQHITMVVSDWGKPVKIDAPSASQVMSQ